MTRPAQTACTPADAKAAWESMPQPSARKVADKLKAAGKPVSHKTVNQWRNAGWPGTTPAEQVEKAEKAAAQASAALQVPAAQVSGEPDAKPPKIDDGLEKNSAITERSLRVAILGAEKLAAALFDQMAVHALQPEVTANSLVKIGVAINTAAEGLATLSRLREGEMQEVPGAVTIIPPEKQIENHPLRASLEAYEKAAKEPAA